MRVWLLPPPGCREKEWSIAPRYCQSATRGWTFLLLLTPRWLLAEGLGVRTYKLSKSGTNVELDASLPLLGCSNWKNDYRHLICGIFDVGIAVHRHRHRHRHRNHSSAGLPSPRYCRYRPRIGAAISKKHFRPGGMAPSEWTRSIRAVRDTPVADYSTPGVNATRRVAYCPTIAVSPFLLALSVS
jgi:hypothetical protein